MTGPLFEKRQKNQLKIRGREHAARSKHAATAAHSAAVMTVVHAAPTAAKARKSANGVERHTFFKIPTVHIKTIRCSWNGL
jgi:hypothetical protein